MTLTRLAASAWKGLTFYESLPRRLLLSGPNGSGKTARLEAIRYALSLPTGKAGLSPYMSDSPAWIAVGTDDGLVCRKAERIEKGDTVSYRTTSSFDPTMGEKSESAVNARVASTFHVEPFLLDLEGWLGKSAPERRRDLMALCAPFAKEIDPATVLVLIDESLEGNPEWPQIRDHLPDPLRTMPLEWLRMAEEAAKARVQSCERMRDGALARLRNMRDNPLGMATAGKPPGQLRDEIAEMDAKIEQASAIREAVEGRARRLASIRGEREGLLKRLPAELRELTGENLAASYAAYTARREADVRKASEAVEAVEAARGEAWGARLAADGAAGEAAGKLAVLLALADAWKPGVSAGDCPVCGSHVEALGEAFALRLHDAHEADGKAKEAQREAVAAMQPLDQSHRKARLATETAGVELRNAQGLRTAIDRLLDLEGEIEREETEAKDAPAAQDAAMIASWRDRRRQLREEMDGLVALEERRKMTETAGKESDDAEASRKSAAAVAKAAGPSGVAGEVLLRMLGPVLRAMEDAAPSHLEYGIRLFDERGGPDAMLVLNGPSGQRPYEAMSGGEKAICLAAFASALAKARPDRKAVLLVEAGEIDTENLGALLSTLGKIDAANVVVATHLEDVFGAEQRGFEVRKLGRYAG